jgi:hypothetical protein
MISDVGNHWAFEPPTRIVETASDTADAIRIRRAPKVLVEVACNGRRGLPFGSKRWLGGERIRTSNLGLSGVALGVGGRA